MKKEILKKFEAYFRASGQSHEDMKTNISDLKKMSAARLQGLIVNFNL